MPRMTLNGILGLHCRPLAAQIRKLRAHLGDQLASLDRGGPEVTTLFRLRIEQKRGIPAACELQLDNRCSCVCVWK